MEDQYPRYETYKGRVYDKGKYLIQHPRTKSYLRVGYIGLNHMPSGMGIGGQISAYSESFEEDDMVNVENGFADIRYITIGDVSEAYDIFEAVIAERQPKGFFEICECVMETITRYFGDYSNVQARRSFLPDETSGKTGTVADFAHKNAGICIERSMLAQNLLRQIGIESTFKSAGFINNNGKADAHAFNLIKYCGRYYIFDSTQPTLRDGVISPIVAEIPEDVYNAMIQPIGMGVSVRVSHYNPLMSQDYDVIYDAGWQKQYDARGSLDNQKRV